MTENGGFSSKNAMNSHAVCSHLGKTAVRAVRVENPGVSGISLQPFAPSLCAAKIPEFVKNVAPPPGGSHEEPAPHAGDPEIVQFGNDNDGPGDDGDGDSDNDDHCNYYD